MSQRFLFAVPVVLATMLLAATSMAQAQNSCQPFRALTPLVFDNKLAAYTGPIYATIGGETLIGRMEPGVPYVTTCDDVACHDVGGTYRIVFKAPRFFQAEESITIEYFHAVYDLPSGVGMYQVTEKITGGTGRFEHATGLLYESGPFIVWIDDKGNLQAQYDGFLAGSICGVKAAGAQQNALPASGTVPSLSRFLNTQLSPSRRR